MFGSWYTDTVDVYRVVGSSTGNLNLQQRSKVLSAIPCRIYNTQKGGPSMRDTAARVTSSDKLACDAAVDIREGDELRVIRGGALRKKNPEERYFAGNPQRYYDPVGGELTGLEHMEVGLLMQEVI